MFVTNILLWNVDNATVFADLNDLKLNDLKEMLGSLNQQLEINVNLNLHWN